MNYSMQTEKFSIHSFFKNTSRMALWCMIISWLMQIIIFSETIQPVFPFEPGAMEAQAERLFYLSVISRVWLVAGMALVVKMLVYKESKGLAFYIAAIGLGILALLELLAISSSLFGKV